MNSTTKIEMINNIYNNFLVLEEDPKRHSGRIYYWCKCLTCGTVKLADGSNIRHGKIRCAQCIRKNYRDISNQKFGLLTAKYPTTKRAFGSVIWFCECECGKTKEVSVKDLT